MFYGPGEYEIRDGEFYSVKTGLPLEKGDKAGMTAYTDPNDISPIETYGKEVTATYRNLTTLDGKTLLFKGAVVRI